MKLLFISLGCDKNLVDSEYMIGMLANDGIEMTDDETQADIIIVNSCCFIGDAKEESINTILEMAQYKETGKCKSLIVTGCLAQRYKDEIFKEIPEVDAILGTNSYDTIVEAVHETLEKHRYSNLHTLEGLPSIKTKRIVTTGGHFAYLKIAEGCNKNCTYCVIPHIRGHYRSVPMEQLLKEAEYMASQGHQIVLDGLGIPDVYLSQDKQASQRAECGLDKAGIAEKAIFLLKNRKKV